MVAAKRRLLLNYRRHAFAVLRTPQLLLQQTRLGCAAMDLGETRVATLRTFRDLKIQVSCVPALLESFL